MTGPWIERAARRRGTFGLDERRWPDPARVEDELRAFLAARVPEVSPMRVDLAPPEAAVPAGAGTRTLALLMPRGRVAVLSIARDPARPGPASRAVAERCRVLHVPHATVSSLAEGRAALRRLGVEPRPSGPAPAAFGRG